jgi:cardiolipin synthase
VFLWLILGPQADLWAVALLLVSGFTDWLDGVVARATGQVSRLGAILDPAVDRLYIAAALIALVLRGIVPWWILAILLGRDLLLATLLPALRRRGLIGLPVHYLGKAATFALLWGFPFVLLGAGASWLAEASRAFGWACVLWGTALYVYAGLLYALQAIRLLRAEGPDAPARPA